MNNRISCSKHVSPQSQKIRNMRNAMRRKPFFIFNFIEIYSWSKKQKPRKMARKMRTIESGCEHTWRSYINLRLGDSTVIRCGKKPSTFQLNIDWRLISTVVWRCAVKVFNWLGRCIRIGCVQFQIERLSGDMLHVLSVFNRFLMLFHYFTEIQLKLRGKIFICFRRYRRFVSILSLQESNFNMNKFRQEKSRTRTMVQNISN